ncbi:Ig-like domain-containing protein [Phenylobacterium sp. LH3H17]|uniref:Ig-like domain-containing protein n=1 Tax=Phenylobacterium sp. LH3H17 TaxID=2903901 RepID=UPI00273A6018|nr:Ig-like domain-containing protein [Phenylobacterium sp. LH3H17]
MHVVRDALRVGAVSLFALCVGVPASQAQSTQYTYDALGRLVSAIDADGKKVAYTYDNAGNRTRLSNGAEFVEIIPTAFTASSNAGTTGLTAANGMKDGAFTALATIHATNTEVGAWIKADLGSVKNVNHIDVVPAVVASVTADAEDINGTIVEYSTDGTIWKTAATANGLSAGAMRTISLGGVALRYLRIKRTGSGQVALGDFRIFSAAAANSPLIANPDGITSTGVAVTFNPMTNDSDQDGHSFTITSVEDPPHGVTSNNAGASITYTPDVGYFGADSFLYTIADGYNGTASARVSVLVRSATNHAPVAVADQYVVGDRATALVDGISALRPLDNDYDSDANVLTITAKTTPANGTATLVGTNLIEYQPNVGYAGPDTFNYTISDGALTAIGAINLTVGNGKPVAQNDAATIPRNTSIVLDPRRNDSDPNGDPITMTAVTSPGKGVAMLNANQTVTYTPNSNFTGSDSFTYMLSDGRGETAQATVSMTVTPPLLGALDVMQADVYASQVILSGTAFSVAAAASTATNVYSPNDMASGKFYWEVKLQCGILLPGIANNVSVARNVGGYSQYNAGIYTYSGAWWATTSNPTSLGVGAVNDVYGFALDADAKTLKIYKNNTLGPTISLPFPGPYFAHSGSQPGYSISGQSCPAGVAQGDFRLGSAATTYSPPSGYSHVPAAAANAPPVAIADDASLPVNTWLSFDPKANDLDANGDTLTYSAVDATSPHGVIQNLGSYLRYTPTSAYTGPDSFSYTVSDGRGGTSTGTVNLLMTSAGSKTFAISPAVAGKTSWNIAVDGPLDLSAGGTWTIIPSNTFMVAAKVWGAGGGSTAGGGGGYAGGTVLLTANATYTVHVGGSSMSVAAGMNGGGIGGGSTYRGFGGGGYSGIRNSDGSAVLIAGGGGGAGNGPSAAGGAGGGATAQDGYPYSTVPGGAGATATSGHAPYQGREGYGDGVSGGGGGGGGGYLGGIGGTNEPGLYGSGGGGGSAFAGARDTMSTSLVAGSGTSPGNAGDAARGTAAQPATAGRVVFQ